MTNDDELLKRMDNLSGWLRVRHYADFVVADEALARIRELKAELAFYKGFHDGVCKDGTHVIVPVDELVSIDRRLNQMMQAAYTVKLEGTKEWDIVAGGADIHGMSESLRAMIRAAQEETR